MMGQVEMLPLDHKHIPGATWWAGSWECRNFEGYFQSREGGVGPWCFQVVWFGNDDISCDVYAVGPDGELVLETVPIDDKARITVCGRKYGRRYWCH